MDTELYKLIQIMADGRFYSGEKLAGSFGITRAAIWKRMQRVRQVLQIDIHRVPGKGYRLASPITLLNKNYLLSVIALQQGTALDALHLLPSVKSTNDYVAQQPKPAIGRCLACLAEQQTAGRGRRGRVWVSSFGQNIYLSLGYRMNLPIGQLSGLSIVAGVSIAQVLRQHGLQHHGLKWPNDLHCSGKKLAGILVDASGDMDGPSQVVIGVGLNMRVNASAAAEIDQPWTDLSSEMTQLPDRNQLAADILSNLIEACQIYEARGLQPFMHAWKQFDQYQGEKIDLHQGNTIIRGRYMGLSDNGGLVLETADGHQVFHAGEVSMRVQTGN